MLVFYCDVHHISVPTCRQPCPQHQRSHPGARTESEEGCMIVDGTLMLVRAGIEQTSGSSDAAKRSHDVQNESYPNQNFVKLATSREGAAVPFE